jgi:hypothetical protein
MHTSLSISPQSHANKEKACEIPIFEPNAISAMLCNSDNRQRFATGTELIFPLSFLTSLHYYHNHQLNSPLHLGRRKSIYRISPSPPKNLVSGPSEREVSTIASSFSDLCTSKSSTNHLSPSPSFAAWASKGSRNQQTVVRGRLH